MIQIEFNIKTEGHKGDIVLEYGDCFRIKANYQKLKIQDLNQAIC